MGNSKRIAFKIVVTLDNNSEGVQHEIHCLKYKFSRNYLDKLEMQNNEFTITGDRSGKPNFDEIFINNQSEIYFQIIKSYIYYCIANNNIFKIQEIKCYNKDDELEKQYTFDTIKNLTASRYASKIKIINKSKASIIFDASPKSTKYFYAMTTLFRSLCSDDNNDIFEKLWKSYNSIYRTISNKKMEWQCLEDMGALMKSQPTDFHFATDAVKTLTSTNIVDSTRWRRMLENKFITRGDQSKRETNLANFLIQYDDTRLNEISKTNIDIEKTFWTDKSLRATTEATIQNKINANLTNDIEIVDVICNHYAYFLRNKTLHGEQTDHSFRFIPYNKEEKTLKFTSAILFAVVCDLINSHTL